MKPYSDLMQYILDQGEYRTDRTGVGTVGIFGAQMRFDLQEGFPLLTLKRTWFKGVAHELLWFLTGDTNIRYLLDNDVHIWDEWANKNGNLGPVYGQQWRSWHGKVVGMMSHNGYEAYAEVELIDQIKNVIEDIKNNPFSRRHIVSAWNPADIPDMALPPCHTMFQFNVRGNSEGVPTFLDCQLYQRSGDMFLGVPFNIASYALLTHMIAQVTGLTPGHFIHTLGDAHIYQNHLKQTEVMLKRTCPFLPRLVLNTDVTDIDEFTYDDITLIGYHPHPTISAPVAV